VCSRSETAGFHNPADAIALIDVSTVRIGGDADRADADLAARHPHLRPQMVTPDEKKLIWGQQILDAIERSCVFAGPIRPLSPAGTAGACRCGLSVIVTVHRERHPDWRRAR
jgi:hypothetical protein